MRLVPIELVDGFAIFAVHKHLFKLGVSPRLAFRGRLGPVPKQHDHGQDNAHYQQVSAEKRFASHGNRGGYSLCP